MLVLALLSMGGLLSRLARWYATGSREVAGHGRGALGADVSRPARGRVRGVPAGLLRLRALRAARPAARPRARHPQGARQRQRGARAARRDRRAAPPLTDPPAWPLRDLRREAGRPARR